MMNIQTRTSLTLLCSVYQRYKFLLLKLTLVAMILVATVFSYYGAKYVILDTPVPVYVLDKLNLRHLSLPNIQCDHCNNFSYNYIIENKNACANQDVFLLTFVTSFHANVPARNMMRQTWASVKEYRGYKLKIIFVFGTHQDKNLNTQTFYEQNLHGDIVQADFADDYRTLTNKSSLALRWVVQNCPQARFILKTDDDSFNVPQRIVDYLIHVKADQFVGGYCFTVMPDRREGSKFHVSESSYPDNYYPTYCAGPGYILSQGAARAIVSVAPNVRYIPMEDVFVSGMCRAALGIQYTEISGMVVGQDQLNLCNLATWVKNSHNIVPGVTSMLWDKVKVADRHKDCVGRNMYINVILLIFLIFWGRVLYNLYHAR